MIEAAVLTYGGVRVANLKVPELDVGQVYVRINVASICGAQLGEIERAAAFHDPYLPHCLGHEGVGEVEAVGPGVTKVAPGDTVVLHWRKGSGIEAAPATYETEDGYPVGAGRVTTFQSATVVSENRVTKIPPDVPGVYATLFGCAVTTGLGIIENDAQIRMAESICVVGCGLVGLYVIQGADLRHAHPIVAVDKNPRRREFASMAGATWTFENLSEIDHSYDVTVDCTGNGRIISELLHRTKPGGKLILVGQPRAGEAVILDDMRSNYTGKTIIDSQGGQTNPDVDIPRYIHLWEAGKLNLSWPVGAHLIGDIQNAIKAAKIGQEARIVLRP